MQQEIFILEMEVIAQQEQILEYVVFKNYKLEIQQQTVAMEQEQEHLSDVGSTTSATGTYTIPGAPTAAGNPIVFASINSANSNYWIVVNPASATTFTYQKSYWTGSGFGGATNENFNYVAYYL